MNRIDIIYEREYLGHSSNKLQVSVVLDTTLSLHPAATLLSLLLPAICYLISSTQTIQHNITKIA